MKVIEEMNFLFAILHGAHTSSDFVSTWREFTYLFFHVLVLMMFYVYSPTGGTIINWVEIKTVPYRGLYSGKGEEDVHITNYNTRKTLDTYS